MPSAGIPFARDCWVLRRKYSGGMYQISKHCCDNTLRPAIVAFIDKNRARGFLRLVKEIDNAETLKQPYEIMKIGFEDVCQKGFEWGVSVAVIDCGIEEHDNKN